MGPWPTRLCWLILIWATGVATLGVVAGILRLMMQAAALIPG